MTAALLGFGRCLTGRERGDAVEGWTKLTPF